MSEFNDIGLLRSEILAYLVTFDSAGIGPRILLSTLHRQGFPRLTRETLDKQLNKLAGEGYIERVASKLGGEPRWRITDKGKSFAQAEGII